MPTTGGVTDVDLDTNTGTSTNERVWPGTRCPSRPARTRFVTRSAACRTKAVVDLVRSSRHKCFVRPLGVVPRAPEREFPFELIAPERNKHKTPGALALERPHQALDDRDA